MVHSVAPTVAWAFCRFCYFKTVQICLGFGLSSVKFDASLILVVGLHLMSRKISYFFYTFSFRSHWICHLAKLWPIACWTTWLLEVMLKGMSSFYCLPSQDCQLARSRIFLHNPFSRWLWLSSCISQVLLLISWFLLWGSCVFLSSWVNEGWFCCLCVMRWFLFVGASIV